MHKYLEMKYVGYIQIRVAKLDGKAFLSSSIYNLPSIQARFHTNNSKTIEATYHSNIEA